jgi:serine/threonine-protein phosphatase 2A regulatory subunit A
MVRRAIAINLGNFAKVLDYPIDNVLKAYRSLLSDKQDAVKIEALKNSCIIARILINNGDIDKAENDVVVSCKKASEETSWRLRFAVAEILSELAHIVGKDLSDRHIKSVVEKLLGDSEAEVRSEIITKVIETVEIIKPDQVLDKLILLIQDPSQHVRESLAE